MEAKVLEHARFELGHLLGVAAEQRELVELRADGALQAAHRIAAREIFEAGEGLQQLLAEHRQALAEGRRLRGHVVRAAGDHHVAVLLGAGRKKDDLVAQTEQQPEHDSGNQRNRIH